MCTFKKNSQKEKNQFLFTLSQKFLHEFLSFTDFLQFISSTNNINSDNINMDIQHQNDDNSTNETTHLNRNKYIETPADLSRIDQEKFLEKLEQKMSNENSNQGDYKILYWKTKEKLGKVTKELNDQINKLQLTVNQQESIISNIQTKLNSSLKENEENKQLIEVMKGQIQGKENAIIQLKNQIEQIDIIDNKNVTDKIEMLSNKIKALTIENTDLKTNTLEQQQTITSLSLKYKDTLEDIEKLTEIVTVSESQRKFFNEENGKLKSQLKSWKQQYQTLKSQFDKTESSYSFQKSVMDQIKDRNKTLSTSYSQVKIEIEHLSQEVLIKMETINKLNQKIKEMKKEILTMKKIPFKRFEIDFTELLNLSQVIRDQINDISIDSTLEASLKANNIIKVIYSFFQNQLTSMNQKYENTKTQQDYQQSQMIKFSSFLQEVFPDILIQESNILSNNEIWNQISTHVKILRHDLKKIQNEKAKQDELILEIEDLLNVQKIEFVKDEIIKMQNNIEELQKSLKNLNEQCNSFKQRERNIQEENKMQKSLNHDLITQIDGLNSEKVLLIDSKISLENETKKILQKQKKEYNQMQQAMQKKIQEINKEADARVAEVKKESRMIQDQVNTQSIFIERSKQDIDDLNNELNSMTDQNIEYRKQVQQLKQEIVDMKNKYQEKMEKEKEKMRNQYSSIIEQVKEHYKRK
ncbi:hypothetical protein TRFO_09934 [Tritrichomonas foetus]|uniref:Uncharacterized protein n=1 Tax=Tritrichomonas foetus TaxID=1144522 RepID=A0A1J4JFX6_9EUKA|nr:hypothetical protein TRFO_09934 [Tritrichomonas foetus]|eukprot:OHS96539.1 hypothetical protein TRFO_09934 [Tritrichomonas foetus]